MSSSRRDTPTPGSQPSESAECVTSQYVNQALRGDRDSLGWVVTRFTPLLKAQAAWRLGSLRTQDSAEDIVAEAWLVALRRLDDIVHDRGRSTPRFLAFLAATVLNIANGRIDAHLRRAAVHQPRPASAGNENLNEILDTVTGAVTNAARSEAAQAIEAALKDLADGDRDVIILRVVEGASNQEAAAELGESPNTISHRYRRAIERLRKALPDSFFDDFDLT